MKVTIDVERLGEISHLIETCDKHPLGVLVAVLAVVALLASGAAVMWWVRLG